MACAWSLYTLGIPDYMSVIEEEIARTMASAKVQAAPGHYCSRIDGSARAVFDTLGTAFAAVHRHGAHTVIHATLSKGSPSAPRAPIDVFRGNHA